MTKVLAVIAGGGTGALFRYLISELVNFHFESRFPYATLVVNILGCFIIGFLWKIFLDRVVPSELKLFLITGFVGSLTTFSTYTLEYFLLIKGNVRAMAIAYVVLSNVIGAAMILVGIKVGEFVRL